MSEHVREGDDLSEAEQPQSEAAQPQSEPSEQLERNQTEADQTEPEHAGPNQTGPDQTESDQTESDQTGGGTGTPAAPETGDLVIDAALRDLAEAPENDLDAQVERGEQVQRTLQGRLSDLGG
ncbi:hypothetical protein [Knoellia sp. LjRoot47]|uniref:hypothetical protein n=1 Tax=Knoellia sp. LjRoot47 TaxID=3342330 RepID=UPI003ECD7F1B